MKISKRLKTIADLIPNDSKVIDVGCDHAYLSIYLSKEKKCKCLATDVNSNALENAKRNMRVDYIGHIADTLGISVDQLFTNRPKVINHRVPRR